MKHIARLALTMALLLPLAPPNLAATVQQAKPIHDDEADAPYKVWNSTPAITMPPLLLDLSDTSAVVEWMTDRTGKLIDAFATQRRNK
jgi:hypothetical protein